MNKQTGNNTTLDPRLAADTILIWSTSAWQTRLMNDRRWPWLIVIPTVDSAEDIDDYPPDGHAALMQHLSEISAALKAMDLCTSTNVATLGNVVKQMHWHVVGRNEGDPNWPAPVWGFGSVERYAPEEAEKIISNFKKAFRGRYD